MNRGGGLDLKYVTPRFLNRMLWFIGIIMVFNIGMFAMFIVLLAGGINTTSVMNGMTKTMYSMDGKIPDINEFLNKLPPKEKDLIKKQVMGILSDVKKISERTVFLLNNVKSESVGKIVNQVGNVMESVSAHEIKNVKLHLMSIVERIDTIVSSLPAETINEIATNLSKLDTGKINNLVGEVAKIHEIKGIIKF